jgi:hypothetical protein
MAYRICAGRRHDIFMGIWYSQQASEYEGILGEWSDTTSIAIGVFTWVMNLKAAR